MSSNGYQSVYLDHAGAAQPEREQMTKVFEHYCSSNQYGFNFTNPHSSSEAESAVDAARSQVLTFVGADSDQYDVIFTSGATAAIKLVGESFPISSESIFCYAKNSHTSVLGLRSLFPRFFCIPSSGLSTSQADTIPLCSCIDRSCCRQCNCIPANFSSLPDHKNPFFGLISFPLECNFSGKKNDLKRLADVVSEILNRQITSDVQITDTEHRTHLGDPTQDLLIDCVDYLSRNTHTTCRWLWLLDVAKFVGTSPLDLSSLAPQKRPHFLSLSFYKIFGYPTGLGALIVRKDALRLMQPKYFGGGNILAAAADSDFCVRKPLHSISLFEQGTSHYSGIAALRFGFDSIARRGGMKQIQMHTFSLALSFVRLLKELRHSNSFPCYTERLVNWKGDMVEVYGWSELDKNDGKPSEHNHGSIVSFNLVDSGGHYVPFSDVGRAAIIWGITLRTGCFCNIGACQEYLQISAEDTVRNYETGRRCGSDDGVGDVINGRPTGAVRVSFGASSSLADCEYFIKFLKSVFLDKPGVIENPVSSSNEISFPRAKEEVPDVHLHISHIYIYPVKSCAGTSDCHSVSFL